MTDESRKRSEIEAARRARVSALLAECGYPSLGDFSARFGFDAITVRNVASGSSGRPGSAGAPVLERLYETAGRERVDEALGRRPLWYRGKGVYRQTTLRVLEKLREKGYASLMDFARHHGARKGAIINVVSGASGLPGSGGAALLEALEEAVGKELVTEVRRLNRQHHAQRSSAIRGELDYGSRFRLALAAHSMTMNCFAREAGVSRDTAAACCSGRYRGGTDKTRELRERMAAMIRDYESGAVRPRTLRWAITLRALELGLSPDALCSCLGLKWERVLAQAKGVVLTRAQQARMARVAAAEFGIESALAEPVRLADLMAEHGVSGGQIGRQAGCTREAVRRIINGDVSLSSSTATRVLELVAAHCGIGFDEAVRISGNPAAPQQPGRKRRQGAAEPATLEEPPEQLLSAARARWGSRVDYLRGRRHSLQQAGFGSLAAYAAANGFSHAAALRVLSGESLTLAGRSDTVYRRLCADFGAGDVELWRAGQRLYGGRQA